MGTTYSKVEEASVVEWELDDGDERVGCFGKKGNESRRIIDNSYEDEIVSPEVLIKGEPIPRRISKATKGEQIAAGWPAWLAAEAGEALEGWLPRRADTFEKIDVIGRGTYSSVYKARDSLSGKIVALKKLRFIDLEPESGRFIAREILILRRLDHPNVIKLEGLVASRFGLSLYLIFEYMEHDLKGITLYDVKLTEPQIKCYMYQLLRGLEYCHSRGVLHRDIKGSNLLINKNGTLKIADFGLSTLDGSLRKLPFTSRCVTLWYRPPELILGETNYGVAVDLWSTGCLLGELYAGMPIMPGGTEVEQLHKIYTLCGSASDDYWRNTKLPNATLFKPPKPYRRRLAETFEGYPPAFLGLIDTLLSFNPEDRGTATSALESEFFTTKPFACKPSSLPKYPPSKEIDFQLGEKADSLFAPVAQDQKGDYDRKESIKLQVPPAAPDGNVGLARLMQGKEMHSSSGLSGSMTQMLEDHELQIQHAVREKRFWKFRPTKFQVKGAPVTDNTIYSSPSHDPSSDGAQMLEQNDHTKEIAQEIGPEKGRGKIQARETSSYVYPGPSYNVDELLEEHDRHIQESAQKLWLETRRGVKTEAKQRQTTIISVSSGTSIVSVNIVDQLLEEHDRQIQESTERLKLEKKRSGKIQAQGIHIRA